MMACNKVSIDDVGVNKDNYIIDYRHFIESASFNRFVSGIN